MKVNTLSYSETGLIAFFLRLGLGAVFIIGGISKLSLLLDTSTHNAMVANYMSTSGYINEMFQQFLFTGTLGNLISPSSFLISLSVFELLSGVALVVGFMVRPLSLIYAFLLWAFVIALPTMTVPGMEIGAKTYTSPAIFVQIRDIALSGMMFVLFNIGAGAHSIDGRFIKENTTINWEELGLLLRLSLASVLMVGGAFQGYANIQSFGVEPLLLVVSGLFLIFGPQSLVKLSAVLVAGVLLWFIVQKFSIDKSIIKNLNGFKREFALLGATAVLALFGGGSRFTALDCFNRTKSYFARYFKTNTVDSVQPSAS